MDTSITLKRQIEAMCQRLEQLYANIDQAPSFPIELMPTTLKELGVAVEELQVANEELNRQSDTIATGLHDAAQQRHYYQKLLNHIPEAYLVTTAEGKIVEANVMAARLLGVPQSSLIGKLLITFVMPEHRPTFRKELARLSLKCQPRNWSTWMQPRDSAPIHLALTTSISTSEEDRQVSLHWILREMAETWTTIATTHPNGATASPSIEELLCNRSIISVSKGETIPLHPQNLWLVHQGLVKLHTLTDQNEEVLLGLLGSSSPFCAGTSFLTVYQAIALTDVQLMQFSMAEVKALPHLAYFLLPKLNQRVQQAEALLAIAGQRRIQSRLYLLLRLLQQEIGAPVANGTRLSLRLTHEDLANACCTSRVTVTRLLGELQRQRKITIDSTSHIVLSKFF